MKNLIALLFLLTAFNARAVVVSISSFEGTGDYGITNSAGTTLVPTGTGFIAVGYFASIADGNIGTSTISSLNSDFQMFGSANTFNFDGVYSLSNDGGRVGPSGNAGFVNKFIYTVVGNGASLLASTNFLIYKHATQFTTDEGNPLPTDVNAHLGDAGDANFLVGTIDGTIDVGGGNFFTRVKLEAVPEPSSLILASLGVLALLRRKR